MRPRDGGSSMVKALSLVAAGLAVGLAVAFWLQSGQGPQTSSHAAPASVEATRDGSSSEARLAELQAALNSEIEQRAALEARVTELGTQLEALRDRPAAVRAGAPGQRDADAQAAANAAPAPFARGGPWRRDAQGGQVEALIAAGFPPDRAAWIERRTSELRMQALQAQYDAQRQGKPFDPGQAFNGDKTLRAELGDADYERYLQAMGRPTSVGVQGVLASSPAERAGLKAGDEVVAYDGKRVFDLRELNALTYDGTAGESVTVSVRRDGQTVQLVLPRGPLGITGGGFRGR
jgi:hypothetical protein